ncbi:hypothetical protein BCV69DRAFT_292530 [Microstroma glucosiphilum]|uniref:Uncharacterized protein n=1 Tax=Pseudomicrostroma glucosiphilum TaxID=1684307 RepID=A0A316UDH6_9BASI|nr:hypothetical protein BCV69DRAFT_292530 [Pseudomicrostroma glucosiphilum]PWN23270.1 hypothetical protein BCV69DRAFT_292530 [Pseudomicrostroma glucosiphilum]
MGPLEIVLATISRAGQPRSSLERPSPSSSSAKMWAEAAAVLAGEDTDFWIELPPPPKRRPTWREYYQRRSGAPDKGKRKADSPHKPQQKRLKQLTLVFGSPKPPSAPASGSTSQYGLHSGTQPSLSGPLAEAATAPVPGPSSRKDRSKQVVAQINPLRPYYTHPESWDYPPDADQSLFVEPRQPSAWYGDQKWQLTHRITPKSEGLLCPWTIKPRPNLFTEAELCGRAFISVELLLKHIERCHFSSTTERLLTCRWDNCSHRTFSSPGPLREHIMDRHTRHLGWGCPFQQCRLSTSIPRDNWQSDQHIDKAHDEMYEPLRPLALPRPAGLPTPTYSADFRTLQPAWTLLLACPKASSRQHSKPLPSQIHQPPAAAAGMIGTVPPVFEPGCHPWNVMHPILDDLEPHAVPLFGLEPLGQESWIDVEELTSEERAAPEIADPVKSPDIAEEPVDVLLDPWDDPNDVDYDEDLSSGFVTPPLPPDHFDAPEAAVISSALSRVTGDRKEVLVQTDQIGIEDTSVDAAASARADSENHLADPSSARSPSIGYSGTAAIPSIVPSGLQPSQREGEPSESREAGVQAGQSMTVMSKTSKEASQVTGSDIVSVDPKIMAMEPVEVPTSSDLPSAAAADDGEGLSKPLESSEAQVQADGDPTFTLAAAPKEVRSSTPPPPYTY